MYKKIVNGELVGLPNHIKLPDGRSVSGFNLLTPDQVVDPAICGYTYEELGFYELVDSDAPDHVNIWSPEYGIVDNKIVVVTWNRIRHMDSDAMLSMFTKHADNGHFSDTDLYESVHVVEFWDETFIGSAGSIRQSNGKLFRSLHDITIREHNQNPSDPANTMWCRIPNPLVEYDDWVPYKAGAALYGNGSDARPYKCLHNGFKWRSNHAQNTWEPGSTGVYTWDKVVE